MPWTLILSPTVEPSNICNGPLMSITSQTSSWRSFNPVFPTAFTWMSHKTLYLVCSNLHPHTKLAAPPESRVESCSPQSTPSPPPCPDLSFLSSKTDSPAFVSPYSHPTSAEPQDSWKTNLIMSVFCQKTAPLSWVIKRNEKIQNWRTKSKYRWLYLTSRGERTCHTDLNLKFTTRKIEGK